MSLTELNRSVYRTGWHTVYRTLRKRLTMYFQSCTRVNENHVLHPLLGLPERNNHGYELRRRRHERGLTMPVAAHPRHSSGSAS